VENDKGELQEKQWCVDSGFRYSGLSGEVEIWHAGDERDDARIAKLDMVICVGDHIWTGERSSAILSHVDMSTFVMKPESEIIIIIPDLW